MSRPRLPAGLIASSLPTDSTSTIGFECLDANEAFGHQTGLNEFVGRKIGDAIPGFGASNPDLLEVLGRVARKGKPENLEVYIKALDMWFSISAFSTESGHFVAIFDNITKRKNYEKQWRLAESLYNSSSEAMLITDSRLNITSVNPAFTRITGYSAEEVLGQNPVRFSSGHHDEAFFQEMQHYVDATGRWEGEVWNMKKSGEIFTMHLSISAIPDDTGFRRRYAAQFSDITEKKRMEEIVARHASFDSLTGLPNRRLFRDRLEQEIKKAHGFRIGVNISPLQFLSREHNIWINHVHEMKLFGNNVAIEITEGILLNDRPEVANSLLAIHDAGIEVAIDDFGTGYSSLSYLRKIQQSIVSTCASPRVIQLPVP